MKFRLKTRSGFSALEAIFAMMLLSFGVVGFMTMFSQMARTTENDDMRLMANHIASEKIEELIATKAVNGYSGINTGTFNENISYDSYQFTRNTHIKYVDSTDLKTESASDTGYKRIDVTVSWNYGTALSAHMMSLVSNY